MHPQTSSLTLKSSPCYRPSEQRWIVAGLLSGNSLLVVGEPGSGKSSLAHFIAQDLTGFRLVYLKASTPKQMVESVADQLSLDPTTLEDVWKYGDRGGH